MIEAGGTQVQTDRFAPLRPWFRALAENPFGLRLLPGVFAFIAIVGLISAFSHFAWLRSIPEAARARAGGEDKHQVTAGSAGERRAAGLLGVQTHFSQRWPRSVLDHAEHVHASFLRDSLLWGEIERERGRYDFSTSTATLLSEACEREFRLLLTQPARNQLYEDGRTVSTPSGRKAFADYLRAVADHYGDCIIAFEIGNEINGTKGAGFAPGTDEGPAYISLLRDVRAALAPAHEDVAILGGSANMIATGFLVDLFKQGMLDLVDGVAVHPYRVYGDSLGVELDNLAAAMREHGSPVPIWVTEFSHDVEDEELAASNLLKSVVIMADRGVAAMSWYSLIEQRWFPNMKLFSNGRRTVQGDAFAQLASALLTKGRPGRVDFGDPTFFAYLFEDDTWVVWGTPRDISVPLEAQVREANGQERPHSGSIRIDAQPVVIISSDRINPGRSAVLFDSLLMWGSSRIGYFVEDGKKGAQRLSLVNGRYDSQFASRWHKPMRIGAFTAAPAGDAASPIRAVWRYDVSAAGLYSVSACFEKKPEGDGIDLEISLNGSPISTDVLRGGRKRLSATAQANPGDRLEVSVGPNREFGGDAFSYRFLIEEGDGSKTVQCPG